MLCRMIKMADLDCFRNSIDQSFHLQSKDCVWEIKEEYAEMTIEFRANSKESFGFTLDKGTVQNRFNFFSKTTNIRPKGIAKICDGIIIDTYKKGIYIFLIELKKGNTGHYKKQLVNSYFFCQWLLNLLKEHKHFEQKVNFVGLLCTTRSNKQVSRHHTPDRITTMQGFPIFPAEIKDLLLSSYAK